MNKRIMWLLVGFIGAMFAFTAVVSAAEKKAPAMGAEKKAAAPKAKSATGEVVSVDAKAGMLTVKAKDKEMSFNAVSKSAKSALEKVKTGDRVTVSYTEKDGKMTARSVTKARVMAKKPAAKTEMKKETKDSKTKM